MATRTIIVNTKRNNVEAVLLGESAKQYRVELMGQTIRWNKADCTTRVETLAPPVAPSNNGTASVSPPATNPSPNKEQDMATKSKPAAAPKSGNGKSKYACPTTRQTFRDKAPKALSVVINNVLMAATLKEFETGSLGWYLNGQTTIEVDGVPCKVQIGCNLTLVGSKELPGKPSA